jgi:hypothetical protein
MRKIILLIGDAFLSLSLMAEKPYTLVLDAGHGQMSPP